MQVPTPVRFGRSMLLILAAVAATGCRGSSPAQNLVAASPHTDRSLLGGQGLAYGPYRDGQSPDLDRFPTVGEMEEDLEQLAPITDRIRTYGASGNLRQLACEASRRGFSVLVGAWLSEDSDQNQSEVAAAVDAAVQGCADTVIVGNEVLLRGDLTVDELLEQIRDVRARLPPSVRVTTAEPWSEWVHEPRLVEEVDVLLVHIYPFWEGVGVDDAVSDFESKYDRVMEAARGKPILVGETGWPSGGSPDQASVPEHVRPGHLAQRDYLVGLSELAEQRGFTFYWFAAYDEEWKWKEGVESGALSEGRLPRCRDFSGRRPGSSWGILTATGRVKEHLADLFPDVPPSPSRQSRTVYDQRGLSALYDLGVDSSSGRRDWLDAGPELRIEYPSGEAWGAVFLTVGEPTEPPRPWKDFSRFRHLVVEIRGEAGGESVQIGLKDAEDPDDGSEDRVELDGLTRKWETRRIPLSRFGTADLARLYVAAEFVFSGFDGQTVLVRRIEFVP